MKKKHKILFPKLEYEMLMQGITQKELGKIIGVSQPTIARKLSGESELTIGDVETICDYFNKDYYELFK